MQSAVKSAEHIYTLWRFNLLNFTDLLLHCLHQHKHSRRSTSGSVFGIELNCLRHLVAHESLKSTASKNNNNFLGFFFLCYTIDPCSDVRDMTYRSGIVKISTQLKGVI